MDYLYYIYNFIIYSFVGWIIEEVYCYITTGHFKTEGFLYGPIKPMYGITMTIIILLLKHYEISFWQKIIWSLIVATSIEFLSGYLLKKIFNEQYWSYSNCLFNIKGLICPKFCIYWAILIMIALKTIVPITDYLYDRFNTLFIMMAFFGIIGVIGDLSCTVRRFGW